MSLFPFLAVLLCTMGALLVLLVLFGYSAGQQDQQAVAEVEGLRLQRVPEQSRVVPWAAVGAWKAAWGATQTVEVAGRLH